MEAAILNNQNHFIYLGIISSHGLHLPTTDGGIALESRL